MLLHHPTVVVLTIVHVSPAAWLKTVWLEVLMVVVGVVMGGLQPSSTCPSIRPSLAFTAILHFTVKRRQEVERIGHGHEKWKLL